MNYVKSVKLLLILLVVGSCAKSLQATEHFYLSSFPAYEEIKSKPISKGQYNAIVNKIIYAFDTIPSTRIPDAHLRNAVKLIESLRIDSMMLQNDKRILNEKITARDGIIKQLNDRIATYKLLKANYDKDVANLNKQIELNNKVSNGYKKEIRQAKTKTTIAWITGAVAVLGTWYFATK